MMTKNYSPKTLINVLPTEQKEVIIKLFGKKSIDEVDIEKTLTKRISMLNVLFSKTLTYDHIVLKVAENIKSATAQTSMKIAEEEILKHQFKKTYDSLSKEEQAKFETELTHLALKKGMDPNQIKSLGIIGTMAAANASGFGLYIMASTIVGGLSSIFGITLPFAFYTSMSSVLSFVTGPVGWTIGLGLIGYSIRNESLTSLKKKFSESINASKSLIFSDYEFAKIVIAYLCSCRLMVLNEIESGIKSGEGDIIELTNSNTQLLNRNTIINIELSKLKHELDTNLSTINSNNITIDSKKSHLNNLREKLNGL